MDPKFREIMRRGASEHWTLRFWFSTSPLTGPTLHARRAECDRIVRDIMCLIITDRPTTVDGVEDLVRQTLDSFVDHGCAAFEIIDADLGNGDVLYLEWP